MTARQIVDHLLSFLREEQRAIPHVSTDFDDPLPHALIAVNASLQTLAVASPLFAVKRPKSAWFHSPQSVAVTGATYGGKTVTCASWPSWAAGCQIQLPGDGDVNRIVTISDAVATLQYPHLGTATGSATVFGDATQLDDDVITVLDPVRTRGGVDLRPATGRGNLTLPAATDRVDFGRIMRVVPLSVGRNSYFVESVADQGDSQVRLRMMLNAAPDADLIVGFNARCSLGRITEDMVLGTRSRFDSALVIDAGADSLTTTSAGDMAIVASMEVGDVFVPYTPAGCSSCTPSPLVDGTSYYVRSVGHGCITLSSVEGGPLLDLTDAGRLFADVYMQRGTSSPFPIPNEFLETLFLPLCVVKFLSSPAMQNFDVGGTVNARALELAEAQSQQGFAMLAKMNPQANKSFRMYPGLG
jgi:hypothetical protein